ncbi:Threonine/homoserine efflux transporter RhtA [Sulfitobacter marinus]|uniref:Threonine/homoserine efflux transporter RhtA n=1 Tax=Sulfitobacter marinus TaxID=394264 RepID=A0A1I6RLE4_9RHOB|nr:DMT family transporter [Sulfitobacter marinus]SFS65278.1 Threonine/homoserine efflux transporter RhtA [Sulfitobacter marinus]
MRIFLLTALVMIAFAANSVLTRFAIAGGYIDPAGFAVVRVASGAVMLCLILLLRGGRVQVFNRQRCFGALTLAVYIIGFSLAYLTLDTGLGALILFGVVQIAMFAHGALFGVAPTLRKMIGAAVAFAGLVLVLWPSAAVQVDPLGAVLMIAAGLGWAAYTIIGKGSADPLANTAGNFLICTPMVALLMLVQPVFNTPTGLVVGILCGAVTSGLGYALWYAVLPKLMQSTAAVVQLSVPVIAILAGAAILAEPVGIKVIVATVLVLGGIGLAVSARSAQAGRS